MRQNHEKIHFCTIINCCSTSASFLEWPSKQKCGSKKIIGKKLPDHNINAIIIKTRQFFCFYLFQSPSKKTSEIYKTGNVEEETKKDGKKISTASTGGPGNQANAMRILVLAQKGDYTKFLYF